MGVSNGKASPAANFCGSMDNIEHTDRIDKGSSFNKRKELQDHKKGISKCPFGHGTAYADPYPGGYVHGKNPQICPSGCVPQMNPPINLAGEIREFFMLLQRELDWTDEHTEKRIKESLE